MIWKYTNVIPNVENFLPDLQFNSSSPLGQSLSPSHNQRFVIHCPWLHWNSSSVQVTLCAKASEEQMKLRLKQKLFIHFKETNLSDRHQSLLCTAIYIQSYKVKNFKNKFFYMPSVLNFYLYYLYAFQVFLSQTILKL